MSFLEELRQRLDIVQVVSGYIPLQRAGKNYKALCPFHPERTPSFFVFPERQTWRCFGACSQGGDVFAFVMRVEQVTFGEAVRLLAHRAGLPLPAGPGLPATAHQPLLQATAEAVRFYHHFLLHSPEAHPAREYLRRRGVREETVQTFQVGCAPGKGDALKRHLMALGFPEGLLEQAGLLTRREDGTTRDLFVGRLLFPIADKQGQPIGFGGRSLDGSEPKYLNTPRTPIFDKGATLYGLPLAAGPARREGVIAVVEGYFDVVLLHQAGFANVVGAMGTALTPGQIRLLQEMAPTVVIALDPDAAGQEAALRTLEDAWRLLERVPGAPGGGLTVYQAPRSTLRIALLPPGKDPDEVVLQEPEAWARALARAEKALDFLMRTLAQRVDLSSPQGKQALAERLLPLVFALPNPFEQEEALERLARLLRVRREVLLAVGGGRRPGSPPPQRVEGNTLARAVEEPVEAYLLALLLRYPDLRPAASSLTPDHFHRTEHRHIFTALQKGAIMEGSLDAFPDPLQGYIQDLLKRDLPPADGKERRQAVAQAVRRLEERYLRELKYGEAERGGSGPPPQTALEVNRGLQRLFQEAARGREGEGE
jgi:DNA primase